MTMCALSYILAQADMSGMTDMTSTSSSGMMKAYIHGSIGGDSLWFNSWVPTSAGATVGVCIGLFLLAVLERYLAAFRRACDASWNKGRIGFSLPKSTGTFSFRSSVPHGSPSSSTSSLAQDLSAARRSSTLKPLVSQSPADAAPESGPSTPALAHTIIDLEGAETAPRYTAAPSSSADDGALPDSIAAEAEKHGYLPRAVRTRLGAQREGRWARPFRWATDVPRGLLHALQVLIRYLLMLVVMSFQLWWIIAIVVGEGVGETLFGRYGADTWSNHFH